MASEPERPLRGLARVQIAREEGALVVRLRIRWHGIPALSRALATLGLRAGLRRARRAGARPELVHAHVFSAGALALPLARCLRVPLVVSEHDSRLGGGALSWREERVARAVFQAADLVAPVSDDLRRRIEARGIAASFEVVPNVIDTTVFQPPADRREGGPPRLLLVGGLIPVKGLPTALEALTRVAADLTLDVVGDGPERLAYEALASRLGLKGRVRFHGERPREAVAELMRGADLYVLSSEWENLPTVVLESLCCGLPVVATRVGGVPEVLTAQDGVLVETGDPAALARAIEHALERTWDRSAIASRGAARFGAEAVIERWEAIYQRVLAGG